jgi:hypothetical protein
VVNFSLWQIYLRETPPYSLKRRLSGPRSRCGYSDEEKKICPSYRDKNPGPSSPQSSCYTDYPTPAS